MDGLLKNLPFGITLPVLAFVVVVFFIDQSLKSDQQKRWLRVAATLFGHGLAYWAFKQVTPDTGSINKLNVSQISTLIMAVVNHFAFIYFTDDALPERFKPHWRYVATLLDVGVFFWAIGTYVPNYKRCVEISKAALAILAAACIFFEAHRKGQQRPIAERWKKLVGITLALAAITLYFNGFRFGYPKYWHRWDQYHYYMGAKYFPELGYKNLYKCAVVAQDETGTVKFTLDRHYNAQRASQRSVDMRKEMRDPDKKIRDLPGENLLVNVGDILGNKAECIDKFTPDRWKEYQGDVAFFRIVSGKGYWTDMQKDHGFNPPPVWTIAGKFLSDLSSGNVMFNQFLASLDIVYIIGMFIALWWGFGWRVFAVGAIFWGTQSSAPFYWTGGAFLRQDWLFFTVLSVACLRKRHFKIGGASLVYAGLLRIFPGLVVIGTLVPTIAWAIRRKKMHPDHLQMLIGGCMAAAVLIPLSILSTHHAPGEPFYHPYKIFYQHTIETHDKTPLTNHMGLRVIVGHKFLDFQKPGLRSSAEVDELSKADTGKGPVPPAVRRAFRYIKFPVKLATGPTSGQMQFTRNNRLTDPFQTWKEMRVNRAHKYRYVSYGIFALTMVFFWLVVSRMKLLWIAQCLGQVFIILGSQLTCYYYSFMILGAPLIKLRKQVELALLALAAITQIIWMNSYWNDNKYTMLTIVSLICCYIMIGLFWRKKPERDEAEEPAAAKTKAATA
jgi:hypothetical protein